jgi:hypothetical protein
LEHERPVILKLRIEQQPGSWLVHELREQPPSLHERLEAQIAPAEFDEIEGAEMHVAATAAQSIKLGKAGIVAGDRLAIDQAGGDLEPVQRPHDERKALCPVMSVASEKPHASGPAPRQQPKAVMLDLVNPVVAGWWPLDGARQARFDKVGEGPQTPQHALLQAARGGRSRIKYAAD